MLKIKNCLFVLLLMVATTGTVCAQSNTGDPTISPRNGVNPKAKFMVEQVSTNEITTNGLYTWVVTGQPETDAQNALEAARDFKQANPEQYKLLAKDQQNFQQIPYAEFKQLSPQKQLYIHQNQQLFQLTDIPLGE